MSEKADGYTKGKLYTWTDGTTIYVLKGISHNKPGTFEGGYDENSAPNGGASSDDHEEISATIRLRAGAPEPVKHVSGDVLDKIEANKNLGKWYCTDLSLSQDEKGFREYSVTLHKELNGAGA